MTYEMRVICTNCYKLSHIKIQLGTLKEDGIKDAECEHCGVEGKLEFS